jgi:predicted SprT family Zn-dependent metalloprotease
VTTTMQTLLAEVPTIPAHMSQSTARRLTAKALRDHGLIEWQVTFNRMRTTAGQCRHGAKAIDLSLYLMAQRSFEDTLQTITHEVAHALTPGHNHDYVWQRKHRELGGNGLRCFAHVDKQAPWQGSCDRCGRHAERYRAPRTLVGWRCRCSAPWTWEKKKV